MRGVVTSRSSSRYRRRHGAAPFVASLLLSVRAAAALAAYSAPPCAGDCNEDGTTTIEEIVRSVRIALDLEAVDSCPAADRDRNGAVTVDEVVRAVGVALRGCDQPTATPTSTVTPTAPTLPSASPPPTASPARCFVEVALQSGIDFIHYEPPSPPPFYEQVFYAGGAAAGDFDGDGWDDLAVSRLGEPSLLLFRNRGDGSFEEISARVGLQVPGARLNGVAWGDVDNDGDLDLYATALGADQHRHYLFVNEGHVRFSEEGVARGAAVVTAEPHFGFSVSVGDFDLDSFLDLHVTEWRPQAHNRFNAPTHNRLLRNRGAAQPGVFDDVTFEAGVNMDRIPPLRADLGFGLAFASRFADMDDDGWPDLLVAADFGTSRLFWNQGNGTFLDGTVAAGVGTDENGMGSTVADVDGDGRLDWFVSAIWDPRARCQGEQGCYWGTTGNRLYRNVGERRFVDVTDLYGVRDAGWGWGASFFDPDNDGDLDLVVANGIHLPILDLVGLPALDDDYETDALRLWENIGSPMRDVARAWGIDDTGQGRGVLVWDYDRDGDLDVFVVRNADRPQLYRNECGRKRHWLRVNVRGTRSNRDGLHARVRVWRHAGAQPQMREIDGGSNFLGQNERTAHFGLGEDGAPVYQVEVRWPATSATRVWHAVPVNSLLVAEEPSTVTGHEESNRSRWR